MTDKIQIMLADMSRQLDNNTKELSMKANYLLNLRRTINTLADYCLPVPEEIKRGANEFEKRVNELKYARKNILRGHRNLKIALFVVNSIN